MKPTGTKKNSRQSRDVAGLSEAVSQSVGLCIRCRHAIPTAGSRNVFVRCALAKTDDRYPRYPVLPVTSCRGFSLRATES